MNLSGQKLAGPRILCISPWFTPRLNSEAFCSAKFVKALAEQGADVTVLAYVHENQGMLDSSSIWESIHAQAHVVQITTPPPGNQLESIRNAFRYHTWLWARWINLAVTEARRRHRILPFDLVYSRSLPMFGQITGYWCSRILNRPWIVNLNDPWDFHLFPVGSGDESSSSDKQLSNFWMKRTFRGADLITYPSDRLRRYHEKLTNIPYRHQIVPHVGLNLGKKEQSGINASPHEFRIVHAGKLGSNEFTGRSSRALLKGLRMFLEETPDAKETTRLILVGPEDELTKAHVNELGLQSTVTSVGAKNYEESLRYIQSAAICVLVEADMPEGIFLASKLVDYIYSEKAVLALSPAIGVVADLVPAGGITRLGPNDANGICGALKGFYNDFRNGTLHLKAPPTSQTEQFRPELVAKSFLHSVNDLIRSGSETTEPLMHKSGYSLKHDAASKE